MSFSSQRLLHSANEVGGLGAVPKGQDPSWTPTVLLYQKAVDEGLRALGWKTAEPQGLYEPMDYFLGLGGKRLRPVLCLTACGMTGNDPMQALPQAMAVEIFHNFTLLHDDVMDQSPLRRGQATVHERFGVDAAILSGDALMIEAYTQLSKARASVLPSLLDEFNRVAMQVCRGQQQDMDFQKRTQVSLEEYREMIGLKTAVLLGSSLKLGALVGGASNGDAAGLFRVGYLVGLAFQVQDDWLDVYADPDRFGKQMAGDIKACKHSFLRVMAEKIASPEQREQLNLAFERIADWGKEKVQGTQALDNEVDKVIRLYNGLGLQDLVWQYQQQLLNEAMDLLASLSVGSSEAALFLRAYAQYLANRQE
ncbi:MAG: polyprenyl synthetase family protein [Bacteroidia bacterium]